MKMNAGKENILEEIRFDENGYPVAMPSPPG